MHAISEIEPEIRNLWALKTTLAGMHIALPEEIVQASTARHHHSASYHHAIVQCLRQHTCTLTTSPQRDMEIRLRVKREDRHGNEKLVQSTWDCGTVRQTKGGEENRTARLWMQTHIKEQRVKSETFNHTKGLHDVLSLTGKERKRGKKWRDEGSQLDTA